MCVNACVCACVCNREMYTVWELDSQTYVGRKVHGDFIHWDKTSGREGEMRRRAGEREGGVEVIRDRKG